jgi:glycosyltransferase involved in cell wall biosynthesis
MNVNQLSEMLSEIEYNAPRTSLGFALPNSLLLKWQSAGPDFHKKIPMESTAHADILLVWWLTNSQASATEADGLTADYLLNLGPFYTKAEIDDDNRLPYDWLVRLFDCGREFSAARFQVSLPSSYAMNRRAGDDFQTWIATIERILEVHSALGPKLFKRIAAYATTVMPGFPQGGVIAPLSLFDLIYEARPDLRAAFDLTTLEGFHAYVQWFLQAGLLQYRLALYIFLHWLRPEKLTPDARYCGEAELAPLILQAALGLGSELDLIEISDDPDARSAVFGWWLRAARNLAVQDEAARTRIEIVRIVRAFWFHANFGFISKAAKSHLPGHLMRLHASKQNLIATYDLAKPDRRAAFLAWWDEAGRYENPDFNILHREFLFSPALGVTQDLNIPITNAALHDCVSREHSFAHLDLSTSVGRLNFFEYLSHLWSADQLPDLRRYIAGQLGSSDKLVDDLCNVARQVVSPELLPISLTGHQDWWLTEQQNHLYRVGYNSHGLTAFAQTSSRSATPSQTAAVDVEIAGFPRAESGQGEDARTIFQSLKQVSNLKLSLFHTRRWLPTPNLAAAELEQFIAPDLQKAKVRIFAFSAFDMLAEEQFEGLSGFSADHLIGYWPWELSRWPSRVTLPQRIADEIWCSTRFIVDSLMPVTTKPIIHMPLPVTIDMATLPGADAASDLPPDRFNFVFVFDGFSYFERKNPLGVIQAFQLAFPKADGHDVGLTIKAMNAHQLPIMQALKMFAAADSRINLIYETWDRPRVMQLVASADALISLHRSEGFGRLMAEAMLLGTPVITSDYSGNRDFCTTDTAFMVGGRLKPLLEDQYIYWNGQEWFEPSVEEAAEHMRSIFRDPGIAAGKVKRARDNIQHNYSLEACGHRYANRINEILASQ